MPRGRDGGLRLLVAADRRVADDPDDLCEPTGWVVTDTNTVADRISGREQRAAEGLVQDYDIRHHIVHRRCEAIDASAGSLLFDVAPADPTAFAVAAGVIVVAAFAGCLIPAVRASRRRSRRCAAARLTGFGRGISASTG